jgi:hypothetical protein
MAPDSYSPAMIFKKRREQRSRLLEVVKQKEIIEKEKQAHRPIYDARAYLERVADMGTALEEKFKELVELSEGVLNSTETDSRAANKRFQAKKAEYEALAKKSVIGQDAPFSGKFSQKPKIISMGDEGGHSVELKLDSFHLADLGLEHIRIDSLSYAKKARMELERVKNDFAVLQTALGTKINYVSSRISSLEADIEVARGVSNVQRGNYSELKELQERAARAKGRTYALLVNTKV